MNHKQLKDWRFNSSLEIETSLALCMGTPTHGDAVRRMPRTAKKSIIEFVGPT